MNTQPTNGVLVRVLADEIAGALKKLPTASASQPESLTGLAMAPAGDMPTPTAMAQSFSLANMVPQIAQHNGGAWNKIEQDTRHYVKRGKGDVFVITGPVFTDAGPRIGANGVKVPTYLYKLVYDATTQRAWAHWQENREGETVGRPISYQELVKRTGVEFLPRSALQH